MNFFKKMFGFNENKASFTEANNLIKKLVSHFFSSYHEMQDETSLNKGKAMEKYKNFYYEELNKLPTVSINHIHLIEISNLQPEERGDTGMIAFLKKMNCELNVFGEIIEVNQNYMVILDVYKPKRIPITITMNIYFEDEFKKQVSDLKKGQKINCKIKTAEELELHDHSRFLADRFDYNLHIPHVRNSITRISLPNKIRYDFAGTLISM